VERQHILIVEDDEDIQQLVAYNLIKAGFSVACADNGNQALEKFGAEPPDLVLLDLMLPGLGGLEVCRMIRRDGAAAATPIVMLTAKGEENDIVQGLEAGADDYITKPFSPKVLVARIKAVLRRRQEADPPPTADEGAHPVIRCNDLTIDPARREVRLGNNILNLTVTEFNILYFLAARPGWVFTRQQIIDHVRGYDFTITPRAVDVQVFGLRKKLGPAGDLIETVRGIGYRYRE